MFWSRLKVFKENYLDGATRWSLANKLVNIIGTIATLLCIAHFLSLEEQGYYYTFLSLAALQVFFDLALPVVISNISSHEYSELKLNEKGQLEGSVIALGRLSALFGGSVAWFNKATGAFIVLVGFGGYFFITRDFATSAKYVNFWFIWVGVHGVGLIFIPYNAILEGCNQLEAVHRNRFFQFLVSSVIACILLASGVGLWAPVIAMVAKLSCNAYLVWFEKKVLFQSIKNCVTSKSFFWKKEVFPLQRKIASVALVNYFVFSFFTPIIYKYWGPEEAARVGMTLQIANALSSIALTWVFVKIPAFGILVAQKKYDQLDWLWKKNTGFSLGVNFSLLLLIGGFFYCAEGSRTLADRVLPFPEFHILLMTTPLITLSQCLSVYFRAHKKEPFVFYWVVGGTLQGVLLWYFGRYYGSIGMAWVQLASWTCLIICAFVVWKKCRNKWHIKESILR